MAFDVKSPLHVPGRPGRKNKLADPDLRKRLIDALRGGNYIEDACAYAGIQKTAYYDWLSLGRAELERQEDGEEPDPVGQVYLDFLEDTEKARSDAIMTSVLLIRQASKDDWKAAAWWLERTAPQRFGRTSRTEISGPEGGPVEMRSTATDDLAKSLDAYFSSQSAVDETSE